MSKLVYKDDDHFNFKDLTDAEVELIAALVYRVRLGGGKYREAAMKIGMAIDNALGEEFMGDTEGYMKVNFIKEDYTTGVVTKRISGKRCIIDIEEKDE